MLISFVWFVMMAFALGFAIVNGCENRLSVSVLQGAQNGIELVFSMAGSLCLWSGFSNLCEKSGLAERTCLLLRPLLRHLFPKSVRQPKTFAYLCENLTANLLGLGNAATPSGIRAVRSMRDPLRPDRATDEMCLLVILNTASIQLIPSTVAAIRAGLGARQPFDLLPAVWLCSGLSVSAGILGARLLSHWWRE